MRRNRMERVDHRTLMRRSWRAARTRARLSDSRAPPGFPDYGFVSTVRDDRGMLVLKNGPVVLSKRPTKPMVGARVGDLRRNGALVLERVEEEPGDWYVQVWLREDNTFRLEYRDGVPSEHYQTRTISREKAAEAMIGWMKRDPTWKDAFQWTNIGTMFEGDYPGDCRRTV